MKLSLEQIDRGTEEVIIRYLHMTERVREIADCVNRQGQSLLASKDGEWAVLWPGDVIYLESVDGVTWLYTADAVYRTTDSLAALEARYAQEGYFRCSKSMVINIYRISHLKSEPGNRIRARMDNGEYAIISRRYAKELRSILRGGER